MEMAAAAASHRTAPIRTIALIGIRALISRVSSSMEYERAIA